MNLTYLCLITAAALAATAAPTPQIGNGNCCTAGQDVDCTADLLCSSFNGSLVVYVVPDEIDTVSEEPEELEVDDDETEDDALSTQG